MSETTNRHIHGLALSLVPAAFAVYVLAEKIPVLATGFAGVNQQLPSTLRASISVANAVAHWGWIALVVGILVMLLARSGRITLAPPFSDGRVTVVFGWFVLILVLCGLTSAAGVFPAR
ncbi:MAG TPA: hypothetical protein VNM92_07045 [Thermoanaerobaculia bacterium]|nr:hypothetical protein [Thermoanaerobaculia bacterium]